MNNQKQYRSDFTAHVRLLCRILTAAFLLCMCAVFSLSAAAAGSRFTSTASRDSNNNICIEFQDVRVVLPSSWAGKCQMNVAEDYVTFCHVRSRELWTAELGYAAGGRLFTLNYSTDDSYTETDPSYMTLGQADGGWYYVSFPTDLQAYTEDEDCYLEFMELSNDIEWVKSNFVLLNSVDIIIESESDDYILPQSSTAYLTESDLSGMDADEIQMAINEIYARHHRKFVLEDVQAYFNSKSWYTGTVEAADFDVSVMNAYEGANINLMVEMLNTLSASEADVVIDSGSVKDAYGMIIEVGDSSFRVRQSDGSAISFWYNVYKLDDMGVSEDEIQIGATISLIYDTDTYEAASMLIW